MQHQAQRIDPEHFSVDGTLIQAWASQSSYRPKDDPPKYGHRRGKLLKRDVLELTRTRGCIARARAIRFGWAISDTSRWNTAMDGLSPPFKTCADPAASAMLF